MLEIQLLDKSYGKNHALDHFTFTFQDGIYGLLGPNGSGKSTLMNIITGNLRADSGTILLQGVPKEKLGKKYYRDIGFMPQYTGMYPKFSVEEMLQYMAELKQVPAKKAKEQIETLLETVELSDAAKQKVKNLSGGMRQRLALVQALLGEPKLVLLDEPTAGLDPKQRIIVRNLIAKEALNRTIIFATHVVSDIESTARSILFLKKGVLVANEPSQKMAQRVNGKIFSTIVPQSSLEQLQKKYRVIRFVPLDEDQVQVRLISEQGDVTGFVPETPSLEDSYLYEFGDAL